MERLIIKDGGKDKKTGKMYYSTYNSGNTKKRNYSREK